MKQKRRFLVLTLMVVVIVGLVLFGGCKNGEKKEEVLTIAFVGPLTGDQAQTGNDMYLGAKLAVELLNQKGGILNKKINLLKYDDGADRQKATNVARLIADDPEVLAVVGHLNSGCSKAALPIYNKSHLAMVTPVSTDDELSQMGFNNFFRIPLKNSLQGKIAATYAVQELKLSKFYVIDDGDSYGKGISDEFEKEVKNQNGTVVGRDQVSPKQGVWDNFMIAFIQSPDIPNNPPTCC